MAHLILTSAPSNCFFFLLLIVTSFLPIRHCNAFGTFGFDIHHRYSDPVKGVLDVDELPVKGSVDYYAAMSHRDRLVHYGRELVESNGAPAASPLAFEFGNETYRLAGLGYLHYANVSVGTPSTSFLVALDTGSDLFWLPCDCGNNCVRGWKSSSGQVLELNIYSLNTSSTSENVLCNNTLCASHARCASSDSTCPFQVQYLSNNTSSTGTLVEDVLHLITDDAKSTAVDANITFGCGRVLTGSFLDGAAPNGLFGLGMSNISVPSTLAREGYTANSFSMCFGSDGLGRISFGDKGSTNQGETPFNLRETHPTYNISITNVNVDGNGHDLEYTAIFDSGTSFTYLNDPAYTLISESFNNLVTDPRHSSSADIPFDYCYDISANQTELKIPTVTLTMKGGDQLNITGPIVLIALPNNASVYCLAVVKSGDVNLIGQNFMTGYRIVFDRERNILGWTPSNCYDDVVNSTILPVTPATPPTTPTTTNSTVPPATAVNPEATSGNTNTTAASGAHTVNHSLQRNPLIYALLMVLIPFFVIV